MGRRHTVLGVVCTLYFGVLLLFARNLYFFTDWMILCAFVSTSIDAELACDLCLLQTTFCLTWGVVVGITVVVMQGSGAIDTEIALYSEHEVAVGNFLIHGVTALLVTLYVWYNAGTMRRHLTPGSLTRTAGCVVAVAAFYCGYMSPLATYDIHAYTMHTFSAGMIVAGAAVLPILVALTAYWTRASAAAPASPAAPAAGWAAASRTGYRPAAGAAARAPPHCPPARPPPAARAAP